MELLKAEMARKKMDIAMIRNEISSSNGSSNSSSSNSSSSSSGSGNSMKFLRQSDIQEMRQKRQQHQQYDNDDGNSDKRQRVGDNDDHDKDGNGNELYTTTATTTSSISHDRNTEGVRDLSKLNINQINQRFRRVGEPIILFGESLTDRIARLAVALTKYYNQEGKDEDRTRTGNLYKDKGTAENKSKGVLISNNDNDDSDDNSIADDKNDKKYKIYDPNIKYSEMKELSSEVMVYKYFKSILKAWARNLDSRPENEKTTAKGKIDTSTHKQCKEYVRPLFKMCKKKNVPPDILMKLDEMVRFCENGDFRSANDKYLRAAIGNAAWPMGLNGVSIHQRAAQDNVGKSNIAHVMNNEIQRKYLTSVKRLMTYAQDLRDDVPPSMKVL